LAERLAQAALAGEGEAIALPHLNSYRRPRPLRSTRGIDEPTAEALLKLLGVRAPREWNAQCLIGTARVHFARAWR